MAPELNDQTTICRYCATIIPANAYFCPNCGKTLKAKTAATTLGRQLVVYSVSFFLPPFGLGYAWKYLRQGDAKSKKIGLTAVILTIISLAFTIWLANSVFNSLNQSLNQFDLNNLGY